MNVRTIMTSNPSACVPGDTVATAARIMKQEDVGPVLVVSDHNEKRLVGIVTDRDLALKVIAEGRDAHNTRLEDVMTRSPVTCRDDADIQTVLEKMADHQVRRMPIVDSANRLVGIVAQADIARYADEEDVGEMVEEISQPYGSGEWLGPRYSDTSSGVNGPAFVAGAICFGIGAGLMYLLDPNQGRRRRHVLQDKAGHYYRTSQTNLQKKSRDLKNRASGMVAESRSRLSSNPEPVSDAKLVDRVRSRMGRHVSHPHAIHVTAEEGRVTLDGAIFESEAAQVLSAIRATPGVHEVVDRLERHAEDTTHPSLQGGRVTNSQGGWSTSRILLSAIGGGLVLYGLSGRGTAARAATTVGLGLVTSGLTSQEIGQLGDLREMIGV